MATADASSGAVATAAAVTTTPDNKDDEVDESGAVADDEVEEAGSEEEYDEEDEEGGEQYVVLKFLLSTEAAGSVIGKNGVTVNELQAQSGTKIQLSKAREFFPGTQERMMLLCGTVSQVLVALHLVFTKLLADGVSMLSCSSIAAESEVGAEGGDDTEVESAMVVPNRLCGGIIGKGGATIHSFMEDSDAQISVSNIHEATGFGERVIHIKGGRESQLRAVALLATKMAEDRHYSTDEIPLAYPPFGESGHAMMYTAAGAHHHVPYAYTPQHAPLHAPVSLHHAPAAYHPPHHHAESPPPHVDLHHHNPHHHHAHAYPHHPHGHEAGHAQVGGRGGEGEEGHMYFMLPDEAVGVIIGKQGRTIQSIRQRSGAHVKIEDSHGTGQRLLAVTGTVSAIAAVEGMIVTRLQQQGKEAALQRLGPNPELPYYHPIEAAAVPNEGSHHNTSQNQQQQQEEQAIEDQGDDEQCDAPPIEAVMQALQV